MSPLQIDREQLRVLVIIASYGKRNLQLLQRAIETYQRMEFQTDVIVLSEAPKDLGSEVEVMVGLPTTNPWSLPFAHKTVFAERLERYDLFIYSEDDMEVTEENIQAFLKITPQLAADEIAGFFRFECDSSGVSWLPDVRDGFHWRPESVRRRGNYFVAEFTNEHAAFYLLTQEQLRKAIASGGFLCAPHEGKYDLLCTAATDPYTQCGFRKVVCVSEFDQFLIHHLSNRYAGHYGQPLGVFRGQIQTLLEIGAGRHPVTTLCSVESLLPQRAWSKNYYTPPTMEVVEMIPPGVKTILSIGCGSGNTEALLLKRGFTVAALPLDSVIGVVAAKNGIEMIYTTLEAAPSQLKDRQFDAILVNDLIHLIESPTELLTEFGRLLRPGGALILTSPNFDYLPILIRRILGVPGYRELKNFPESRVHPVNIARLRRDLRRTGFKIDRIVWQAQRRDSILSGAVTKRRGLAALFDRLWRFTRATGMAGGMGRFMSPNWSGRALKRS